MCSAAALRSSGSTTQGWHSQLLLCSVSGSGRRGATSCCWRRPLFFFNPNAVSLISLVAPLLLFLAAQGYFRRGLMSGSLR